MSKSAFIRDINSLEQLRIAIARFCEESESHLKSVDSKIQTRISKLKSNEFRFQQSIENTEDDLHRAKSSLYSCESDTYEDEDGHTVYPNCDYEENEVIEYRYKLQKANENYNIFKREIRNLEKAIGSYQNPKFKYRNIIQFEREIAINSLKQLIDGAENYLSVSSHLSNSGDFSAKNELLESNSSSILETILLGVPKIIIYGIFNFIGFGGKLFNISNKNNKGLITTSILSNGTDFVCSELRIKDKTGTILSVNIPSSLQEERIGKHLINNIETICRLNNCNEVKSFSSPSNIEFYKNLNYKVRNENINIGAEVFKTLENNYTVLQQNAINVFENSKEYIKLQEHNNTEINPLMVVTPEDFNDTKFWKQRGQDSSPERYVELLLQYEKSKLLLKQGKSLDEILIMDSKLHNAYQIFKNQPIRLTKKGNYFQVDQGRHRIMAAQFHFQKTGEIIPITADITEYKI